MTVRLIDYCLTSSVQYYRYIQDENKFNSVYKLSRNEGRDGSTVSMTLYCQ